MLATTTSAKRAAVRLAVVATVAGMTVGVGTARAVVFDGGASHTGTTLNTPSNWVGDVSPGATGEAVLDNSVFALPSTLFFGGGQSIGSLNLNSPTLTRIESPTTAGTTYSISIGGAAGLPIATVGPNAVGTVTLATPTGAIAKFILPGSGQVNVTNADQTLNIDMDVINKSGVTASLEKTGAGTLILGDPTGTNTRINTFGGTGATVTVSGGVLQVGSDLLLGANTAGTAINASGVTLNGGTLRVSASAAITSSRTFNITADGSGFDLAKPFSFTISSPLTGSAGFSKTGTGELILNSAAGTYNGTIALNGGSLRLLNTGSVQGATVQLNGLNSTLNLRRDGGGTYNVNVEATVKNAQVYADHQSSAAGGLFTLGTVKLGGVTLNANGNAATAGNALQFGAVTLTGNGTIQTSAIPVTIGAVGQSGGSYGFRKTGSALLTLTQPGTFTGGVNVAGGTLQISADEQLGAAGPNGLAPVTVASSDTPASTTTLRIAGSYVTNRPVIAGDGVIENASDVTLGAVSGSGLLVKNGAGKLTVPSIVGGGLSVGDGSVQLAAGGGTSRLASFGYAIGKLDVTDNRVIFSGPAAGSVRGWLASGGIVSATAQADSTGTTGVGYLTVGTTELDVATWGGLGVSAGDVVTKLTYTGDINLDGKVNADDFTLMDRGLAKGLAAGTVAWVDGDVNYDGAVTSGDFLLADKAFARNGGVLSAEFLAGRDARFGDAYVSELVAAVPEPTVGGLAAVVGAAMSLGGRRGRRAK